MSVDSSIYYCVVINELFSAMDKTLKLTLIFTENSCEKNLIQYGDNHGFIPDKINLLLSVLLIIYTRASNTFKQ